ncbi:MAG: hypothetical protein QY316_00605 [Thermodesulfobacteriota bacterium]|nr:MAG: hypothetical protein QY316_00605 [Thermodesulfobacteriota bacterium]
MGRMKEFLQEESGQLSMTRLTIFLILISYIGWATVIVIARHTIPDMPYGLAGLLVGLYGFNTANINLGGGNDRKP